MAGLSNNRFELFNMSDTNPDAESVCSDGPSEYFEPFEYTVEYTEYDYPGQSQNAISATTTAGEPTTASFDGLVETLTLENDTTVESTSRDTSDSSVAPEKSTPSEDTSEATPATEDSQQATSDHVDEFAPISVNEPTNQANESSFEGSVEALNLENEAETAETAETAESGIKALVTGILDTRLPLIVDIVREESDQSTPNTSLQQYVELLNNPDLDPSEKARIQGTCSLGLFLANSAGQEIDEQQVKREVTAFVCLVQRSPVAKGNITHLDIGWRYVLDRLPKIQMPHENEEADHFQTGERHLQEEKDLFYYQENEDTLAFCEEKRHFLLKMLQRVVMVLPELRTMTFHDDKDWLHCSVGDGYLPKLVAPFMKLQVMSILCERPFVAIAYIVKNGKGILHVFDSMVETVHRLSERSFYTEREWLMPEEGAFPNICEEGGEESEQGEEAGEGSAWA